MRNGGEAGGLAVTGVLEHGVAVLEGVAAGPVTVWHPYANAENNQLVLDAPADGSTLDVTLDVHGRR